jgi:hypothetical protein
MAIFQSNIINRIEIWPTFKDQAIELKLHTAAKGVLRGHHLGFNLSQLQQAPHLAQNSIVLNKCSHRNHQT